MDIKLPMKSIAGQENCFTVLSFFSLLYSNKKTTLSSITAISEFIKAESRNTIILFLFYSFLIYDTLTTVSSPYILAGSLCYLSSPLDPLFLSFPSKKEKASQGHQPSMV